MPGRPKPKDSIIQHESQGKHELRHPGKPPVALPLPACNVRRYQIPPASQVLWVEASTWPDRTGSAAMRFFHETRRERAVDIETRLARVINIHQLVVFISKWSWYKTRANYKLELQSMAFSNLLRQSWGYTWITWWVFGEISGLHCTI